MKDEGFEYTPLQQASVVSRGAGDDVDDVEWSPDKREWVEKYGYGIVSNPWGEQAASDGGTEVEDPNQAHIGTLSAAETEAYYAALYGEMSEVTTSADDEEAATPEYDWKTAGCSGKASHESMSATDDVYQQFSELTKDMNNLYAEVEGSDGVLELDKQWSACMEPAGFSFTRKIDAEEAIGKELGTLGGVPDGVNDGDLTDKDKAKAAELGKKEIKTALADLDCREKLDYTDKKLKLQFAAEEKFIADNKAELEQFKAAIDQAEKD